MNNIALDIAREIINFITEGGPGSGNWHHKGIKGHRGGSMPGGGRKAITQSLRNTKAKPKLSNQVKQRAKEKQQSLLVLDKDGLPTDKQALSVKYLFPTVARSSISMITSYEKADNFINKYIDNKGIPNAEFYILKPHERKWGRKIAKNITPEEKIKCLLVSEKSTVGMPPYLLQRCLQRLSQKDIDAIYNRRKNDEVSFWEKANYLTILGLNSKVTDTNNEPLKKHLMASWEGQTGGNPIATLLVKTAKRVLKAKGIEYFSKLKPHEPVELNAVEKKRLQKAIRDIYKTTQEKLKKQKKDSFVLYRGNGQHSVKGILMSYTEDQSIAKKFGFYIEKAKIKRQNIFASYKAHTVPDFYNEKEFIVINK